MQRVTILCEGHTELNFVQQVLAPYLGEVGVAASAPLFFTRKNKRKGQVYKGGVLSYQQVRRDTINLLKERSVTLVTTMLDFYPRRADFPGYASLPPGSPYEQVRYVTEAFQQDIGEPHRFKPYFSLHEFEALVFADSDILSDVLINSKLRANLETTLKNVKSPEEINLDSPPGQRLAEWYPAYRKSADGINITRRIGLPAIRRACPHFDRWVTMLESPDQAD